MHAWPASTLLSGVIVAIESDQDGSVTQGKEWMASHRLMSTAGADQSKQYLAVRLLTYTHFIHSAPLPDSITHISQTLLTEMENM